MAIQNRTAQNQNAINQIRTASEGIKDEGVRAQFNEAVDHLEGNIDRVDIDNVISGLLKGGDAFAGHAGRLGMGLGLMGGMGALALDQGQASIDSVVAMVNEFALDKASRGTGDAVLLALPDVGEAVIHAALATFLAAGVFKTGKAYANMTFNLANKKAEDAAA